MAHRSDRATASFPALAVGLVSLSWIILLVWDASPYSRYLHHGDWATVGFGASICRAVPGSSWLIPALFYGSGWLLMSAAMMLPTAAPLVRLFDRMIKARPDRVTLHSLLIAGYLLAWAGFGIIAHVLDQGLHAVVASWIWFAAHPYIPGAAILSLAGMFQFSSLKYYCLEKCRTPFGFITHHWHGRRPGREAFQLGLAHGGYCVGCCWALMLLMFLVGTGSLAWMLLLCLLMAVEKNHSWGRRLSAPLGGMLLAIAGFLLFQGLA
jgi:predicted metal-binding membrane protein